MFKRIHELLNIVKPDVDKTRIKTSYGNIGSLETMFPDITWINFLDTKGKVDFSYNRVNDEEFEVIESLYSPDEEDYTPFLDNTEMLLTVQQALRDNDYTAKIQRTTSGYDLILTEVDELEEEWTGSVKTSWKKNDIIDVFKNPSKSEILKMTKGGKTPVRYFIALNGDLYVWAFDDAEHDEVSRQLGKPYRVKGVYYSPEYVEFFKVMKPQLVYPEVENSKLKDLLDTNYHDNLLRKK